MLLVSTVTTEQQLGSPTTVANVIGQLNNNKEGLPLYVRRIKHTPIPRERAEPRRRRSRDARPREGVE